jgi:hypothetical protein
MNANAVSVEILGMMFRRGCETIALSIKDLFSQLGSKILSSTHNIFLEDWPKNIYLI